MSAEIWGKVNRIQISHAGRVYPVGSWIEFQSTEKVVALRLAAENKIELYDYSELFPNVSIGLFDNGMLVGEWSQRLNLKSVDDWHNAETDYVLMAYRDDISILKNPAKLAALVSIKNWEFFCAFAYPSDKKNLNQIPMSDDLLKIAHSFVPDLRIPVLSANWMLWTNHPSNIEIIDRFEEFRQFPRDVALTLALYIHKPFLWTVSDLWK